MTTDSNHERKIFPNLARDRILTAPNQLWRVDIIYIRLRDELVLLAVPAAHAPLIVWMSFQPARLYGDLKNDGDLENLQKRLQYAHRVWRRAFGHAAEIPDLLRTLSVFPATLLIAMTVVRVS